MNKRVKNYKGFSLVELLLVMGLFIILSVIGFNGFLSIRESFIARENVELIIQDIESTKLKAMNMEGGRDATWIYGFGIDFTQANQLSDTGNYTFFKWCSPVVDYGATFLAYGQVTENTLPNLSPNFLFEAILPTYPLCGVNANYQNGWIPTNYYSSGNCQSARTCLLNANEISTLIDREVGQMEVLPNFNTGLPLHPNYLFFESLTGRAIIYNRDGKPQSYEQVGMEVVFNNEEMIPLDIVLHRKRSDKFDLITVYPNSGEVIHHVYDEDGDTNVSNCTPGSTNIMEHFKVGTLCYERYGIDDEIDSFR